MRHCELRSGPGRQRRDPQKTRRHKPLITASASSTSLQTGKKPEISSRRPLQPGRRFESPASGRLDRESAIARIPTHAHRYWQRPGRRTDQPRTPRHDPEHRFRVALHRGGRAIPLSGKGVTGACSAAHFGEHFLSECQAGPRGAAVDPAAGKPAPVAGTRSRQKNGPGSRPAPTR